MTALTPLVLCVALLAVLVGCLVPVLRRRALAGGRDTGASALEFAIIAAIVVVAASVIGAVIYNIVDKKSTKLDECANQAIGAAKCAP